jgi:hypothetical protein
MSNQWEGLTMKEKAAATRTVSALQPPRNLMDDLKRASLIIAVIDGELHILKDRRGLRGAVSIGEVIIRLQEHTE